MEQTLRQQRLSGLRTRAVEKHRILPLLPRAPSTARPPAIHRRQGWATAQSGRFFNIQIQASWGNGQNSSSGSGAGGEAYVDSQPSWGGILNNSSSGGGGSSAGGKDDSSGSPITRLLAAAKDHVRAAPLPGAASPWLALALVPVVLWCLGWVFTTGMFTLAQTSMSGMCSVAKTLYPSIPLRGASYEDIAVSLVKALATGTDQVSTWSRPGLVVPAWLMRALMSSFHFLAAAGVQLGGSLMHSTQLLAVTGLSKGLLYASCLLFMLPLGSGLSSLTAGFMQRLQQLKPGGSSGDSSSSGGAFRTSSSPAPYGGSSSSSGSSGGAAAVGSSNGFSLPKLTDTSALTLKLAGVLAWPCISAAAVLQPSLLLQANSATGPLGLAAPQVLLCLCLLTLLLTVAAAAGSFAWDVARRQADAVTVVEFGWQLGMLCAVQAGLNAAQLVLSLVGGQIDVQQLGMPVLSTLILCRIVWSTWRLWRIGASEPTMWLQLLTLTPTTSSTSSGSGGGSGGGGSGYGSSGGGSGSM